MAFLDANHGIALIYLVASICFILGAEGPKWHPETSRRGNISSA